MKPITLVFCLGLCVSCKPQNEAANNTHPTLTKQAQIAPATASREVSGQVFVALRNGESVRLGGVAVLIYRPETANVFLDQARSNSAAARPPLLAAVNAAEEATAKAKAACRQADTALQNAIQNGAQDDLRRQFRNRQKSAIDANIAALDVQIEAGKKLAANSVATRLRTFDLPSPDFKSVTDADGKFTASLPAKEFVAVVRASRMIGKFTESYLWVETIPANQTTPVLFSNENILRE